MMSSYVAKMNLFGFLLLFMTAFCGLNASSHFDENMYKRSIQSINYTPVKDIIVALIELSDQSNWQCCLDVSDEDFTMEMERELPTGKEVFVWPCDGHSKGYRLVFKDQHNDLISIPVLMTKETKLAVPTKIEKMEKVLITPGGWFSNDVFCFHVHLTDGSIWKAMNAESAIIEMYQTKWKKGHTIIVTKATEGKWGLVNIDAPNDFTAYGDFRWLYVNPVQE